MDYKKRLEQLLKAAYSLRYTQHNIERIPICVMQEKEVKLDMLIAEIKEELVDERLHDLNTSANYNTDT